MDFADFADVAMANRATARMAKLVDAWDLKSPARKGVPVRFRLRAPSKIKGLRAKANANPCSFLVRNFDAGPQLLGGRYLFAYPVPNVLFGHYHRRMPELISRLKNITRGFGLVGAGFCSQIPHLKFRFSDPGRFPG